MNEATHSVFQGLYRAKLPSRPPTLREALTEAVEVSDALSLIYSLPCPAEAEIDRLEDQRRDAEDALYAALAEHGIDRKLASKFGEVL